MRVRYAALLTTLLLTSCAPAFAQGECADTDIVKNALKTKYSESVVFSGYQSRSGVYTLWFSQKEYTWTILVDRPNGKSCIVASGTHGTQFMPGDIPEGDKL